MFRKKTSPMLSARFFCGHRQVASHQVGQAVRFDESTRMPARRVYAGASFDMKPGHSLSLGVIPAKAGIQVFAKQEWIPVFTGMTSRRDDPAGR
jgi:hypothetical protein